MAGNMAADRQEWHQGSSWELSSDPQTWDTERVDWEWCGRLKPQTPTQWAFSFKPPHSNLAEASVGFPSPALICEQDLTFEQFALNPRASRWLAIPCLGFTVLGHWKHFLYFLAWPSAVSLISFKHLFCSSHLHRTLCSHWQELLLQQSKQYL